MGSPHHGGWLGDRVLPFLDRHTTHTQRARLPLVAACWTSLFVLCSLGTFLLGRGSDAQAEACAGTWVGIVRDVVADAAQCVVFPLVAASRSGGTEAQAAGG